MTDLERGDSGHPDNASDQISNQSNIHKPKYLMKIDRHAYWQRFNLMSLLPKGGHKNAKTFYFEVIFDCPKINMEG